MILLFFITACVFQILALYATERFIKAYEPRYKLKGHRYHDVIIILFSVLAVLSSEKNISPSCILSGSVFYGFLTLFIFLDAERNWLPKCFTFSFITAGALYRTFKPADGLVLTIVAVSILWAGIFLLRNCINKRAGGEVFGLGDIYLIVGLAVWFPVLTALKLIIVAAVLATIFLLIKKYRFPARWRHHHEYRGVPFAPFLCGVAALWGVLPVTFFS